MLEIYVSLSVLKHDVMSYHHGMGAPPQRPLQVRNFCGIIVDRRTNVLSLSIKPALEQQLRCQSKLDENVLDN